MGEVNNRQRDFLNTAMAALRYAVRAPSTHNTQPWLFKIKEHSIVIYEDTARNLPCADPINRDKFISLGCLLENLIIATKYLGCFQRVELILKDDVVAEIMCVPSSLKKDSSQSYLIDAIEQWINARGEFRPDVVDMQSLQKIHDKIKDEGYLDLIHAYIISSKTDMKQIAVLTEEGVRTAHSDLTFRKEMSYWMHHSYSRKREGIPGYALNMPGLVSLVIPTLITYMNMGAILAKKSSGGILSSAGAIIFTSDEKNDKEVWVKTGQAAQRYMLELHAAGFDTSIYVAAIEMQGLSSRLAKKLRLQPAMPQFLFVTGHVTHKHKPTPRIAVEHKIIHEQ